MGASRIAYWDNARFAAITLVVVGHAIQRQTIDSSNALAVYLVVYAFHMPAFALISGYFSKETVPDRRELRRLVTDFLIPYALFEGIWSLVQWLVEGKTALNPTQPSWTLWFLLALAIFRVALPYLALLRWPLAWAILASVGVGYLSNVDSTFSLSRAIGILPFFVAGWLLRQTDLVPRWMAAGARVWPVRAAALGILVAWTGLVLVMIEEFRRIDLRFWFFYDDSYAALGEDQWWAGAVRLGLIALAMVLSAAFLALIPRRETFFTALGQATMYVYLLHSFVLYPIRESGVLRDDHSSATWLVTMLLASTAITIALSSPLVRRVFRPLVQPRAAWLFRDEPALRPVADPVAPTRERS